MFEENGVAICQQGGNIVRPVCNDRSHFRPSPSDINKTPKMPPDATSIPRLNIFEKRLTNQRELCAAGNELSVVLSQGFSPSIMEHTLTEIESSGCDNESNSYVGGCKVPNSALKPVIESNSSGLYSPTESSKKIGKENCDSKKLCVNEKSHCLILNNGCKCNHYTEAKLTGIIPNCLIDSGLEAEFSSEMDMSQLINSHPNNENAFHSTNFTRNSSTEDVSYIKETIGNHNCHFPREEFKENDGDHTYAKLCTNTLMTTSKSGDIDDDVFESLQFNISQMLEREEMVYTRVKSVVSDCQNDILNPKLDKSSPKDQLVGKNVPTIVPLEVCNSDIPVVAINSPNSGIAQMKNSEDVAVVPNSAKNKLLQSCRKLCVNNKAHIKMSGSGGSIVTSEVNAAKNSAVEVFVLPSTTESSPECNECNQGNSNVIMGFATASGKEVSISKIALQKAKEFLWEEDISHSPMECISGVVNVPKDALQKVVMSPEAVKNEVGQWKPVTSVMLLKDGVAISSDQTKDLQVEICPKAKSFQGFSTASGKRVTVCAATLEKSKNIFRDESLSQINAAYLSKDTIKSEQANKEMMGSVSSFGECSSEENMCKTSIKENNDSVTGQNMKHVMKPPKRLLKNLSCDYPYQQKLDRKLDSNDMAAIKLMSSLRENFQGFSTASGKLVAVSDTALKKAQVLLCADDSPTAANLDEDSHFDSEVPNALPSDKHSGIGDKLSNNLDSCVVPTLSEITHANIEGFKTASGKKVVVSPMALERTKKLFTEDHSQNNPMRSDVNVTPVLAFSTASGKNVVVSPTALERARSLYLENGSHSVSSHPVENVDISGHCMQGLSSRVNGAKQRRSTNNESVRHENKAPICNSKCNSLSIDTSQFHIKVPDDCVMLKGFNTAGGKFIKINEESLESARQLFSRDDYSIDDSLDSHFRHGANKRHQKRSLDNLDTSREQVRTYGTKKVRLSDSALEVPEMSYNDLLSFDEQLDSMTKENQIVPSDSVFDQSLKEICTSFSSEVMCDPDARKNDLYNLPKEVSGIKSGNSNSNASKNSIVLMASLESLKSKMRNAKHADRRSTSSINHEISTEILETTEAFLADELIDDNEVSGYLCYCNYRVKANHVANSRSLCVS